jgi:hypothetical protein
MTGPQGPQGPPGTDGVVATYFAEGSVGAFASTAGTPGVFTECAVAHLAGAGEVAVVNIEATALFASVDTYLFVANGFDNGGGFAFANAFYSIAGSTRLVANSTSQAHIDLTAGQVYTFAPIVQTLDTVDLNDLICSSSVVIVRATP